MFLVGEPDVATFETSNETGNFIVYAYGDDIDLLVNEITPYSGTVIVPGGTVALSVLAPDSWAMEITSK